MIVIMTGITMGGNHDLKAVAPKFFGKGNTDVVCRIRVYFICLKGLVAMITSSAALIVLEPFGFHELLCRQLFTRQIEASDIRSRFGLHFIGGILNYAFDLMKSG